jgi:hypothetical protein
MEKINLDKKSLRKFGITMGIAFLVITLLMLIRHRHSVIPTSIISALFFVASLIIPGVLKPAYILWMKLAFVLGWVNTRLILMIIFYILFTPAGLIMRLFRVDLLDRKIDKSKDSYWKKREKKVFNPSDYERLF